MSVKTKRIKESFDKALHISAADHPKIVIMSDCHRGTGTWGDNFLANRPVFTAALKHYYQNDFTYIELGDGDELWENRRFSDVYHTHREIYELFEKYHQDGRLFLLFGNHDRVKENGAYVWRGLSHVIPFYESVVIDGLDLPPICCFHGYQGDLINDRLWKLSRWLVRYLWRPLELRGIRDPTSAAKNYTRLRTAEDRFIRCSCQQRCILIAGHTHKPAMMATDCGVYMNSGSCVHPSAITAIELTFPAARLVKWSVCSRSDMTLSVCKEVLSEMNLY